MNNTYRIPSKEFKDFRLFRREVAKLAKEMVLTLSMNMVKKL
ncbi:MAG: hypothetical protein ACLT07_06115 [Clostridia bacterium]